MACRHCGNEVALTAARRRTYNYTCTRCANQQRDADVGRYMARKLADSLRRQGYPGPYPGVDFVRQVLARDGERVAAAVEARHTCVVLRDPRAGYTMDNAVLMTGAQRYAQRRAEATE